jgi:hypothetical protein
MQQPRVDIGFTLPVRRSSPLGHSAGTPARRRSVRRPSVDFHSSTEFITGSPCRPAGFPAGQTTLPLLDFSRPTTQSQAGGYVSRQRIPPPPGATFEVWIPPARLFPPALPTLARRSVHGLIPSRVSLRCNRYPSRGPCPPAITHGTRRSKSAAQPCSRLQGLVPATNPFCHQSQVTPVVDPFLGFDPPEHAPIRPGARFLSRRLPSRPLAD